MGETVAQTCRGGAYCVLASGGFAIGCATFFGGDRPPSRCGSRPFQRSAHSSSPESVAEPRYTLSSQRLAD